MILVRLVFQAKSGKAGQVVEDFKQNEEMMRRIMGPGVKVRFLTVLSGPFDTVVQEMEFESLAEWERRIAEVFSLPEFHDWFAHMEPLVESGRREFYNVEG